MASGTYGANVSSSGKEDSKFVCGSSFTAKTTAFHSRTRTEVIHSQSSNPQSAVMLFEAIPQSDLKTIGLCDIIGVVDGTESSLARTKQ
jgi:hypothetical protein